MKDVSDGALTSGLATVEIDHEVQAIRHREVETQLWHRRIGLGSRRGVPRRAGRTLSRRSIGFIRPTLDRRYGLSVSIRLKSRNEPIRTLPTVGTVEPLTDGRLSAALVLRIVTALLVRGAGRQPIILSVLVSMVAISRTRCRRRRWCETRRVTT
eukprot:3690992-Prymnesium_polylepis.1